MHHRLIAAAILAAVALAATTPAVRSAFATRTSPGQSTFAAAAQFAPRNIIPPAISGAPREGDTLQGAPGTWMRAVDSTTGTWLRGGTPVGTGNTYAVTTADVGHTLAYRVTATNSGGSGTAESAKTIVVLPAAPRNLTPPRITGDAVVGATLTASGDTWSGAVTSFSFRWVRCLDGSCRTVPGATGRDLLLTGADVDGVFTVEITAENDGGYTTARSTGTDYVRHATFTQVLCRNPDDGRFAGRDGELPDGLAFGRNVTAFPSPDAATRCGSAGGVPLSTGGQWSTATLGAGGWLRYRAGTDLTFTGATLFRRVAIRGGFSWRLDGAVTTSLSATPRWDGCSSSAACAVSGSLTDPFGTANRATVETGAANGFNLLLACEAVSCQATGAETVDLLGGRITLRDQLLPVVTTPATGGLATDAQLDGIEELTFAATDAGAGLYRLRVRIGTQEVATRALAPAGDDRCADVNPANGDVYEFAYRRPCPASVSTTQRFDTSTWPKTGRLQVLLEDAGRNTVALVSRDVG